MTTLSAEPGALGKRPGIFRRFLAKPLGLISSIVFAIVLLAALFAPLLAPYDPNVLDLSLTQAPPSAEHWLGGDLTGRDMLSRLLFGASTTMLGGAIAVVTAILLGVPTGIASGYFGGAIDRVATWFSDALQSIPGMIVLLIVAAGTGQNFVLLMVTIGVFMAPGYFRISRSRALMVRNEPYIDAAKVSGMGSLRILFAHVLRAVSAPVIIQSALTAGIAMGLQAGLQFLGIGSATIPSWGAMMSDGFRTMLVTPLVLLWPSLALGITIAALAIMGSTLADVVSVPRAVRRTRKQRLALEQTMPRATVSEHQASESQTDQGSVSSKASESEVPTVTGSLKYEAEASAVRIDNLRVSYATPEGEKVVVRGIQLDIVPGEVLGIVGESGSGKSQTIFSVLDLLPDGGHMSADSIWVNGVELSHLSRTQRRKVLRSEVGYVPQEPMTNLDPAYTVKYQLLEPLRHVHGMGRKQALATVREALTIVGCVLST